MPGRKPVAIIYDFDGTLTPRSSLEYTLFPYIGISAGEFWELSDKEALKTKGDYMLVYMRLVLTLAKKKNLPISRKVFKELAGNIRYCRGVEGFFHGINRFSKGSGLRHYIISGNLREIMSESKIAGNFHNIFGCEYYYEKGRAVFPNVIVNSTLKTRYIFRINKGKEKLREDVNEDIPASKRAVPFENMIYIGDGLTDVPSMAVVKGNGGSAVAVYNNKKEKEECKKLLENNRVNYIAKADYSEGSRLVNIIKSFIRNNF